jgi:hypothetical protein
MAKKLRVKREKLEERFIEKELPGSFEDWYQNVTKDFFSSCKWNAAVDAAREVELISKAEYDATHRSRPFTLKQYLWTRVTDPQLRALLKQHAIDASMAARRGTIIMNLLVQHELNRGGVDAAADMMKQFLDHQTFVKQCFLPEKWIESTRRNRTPIHPKILEVLHMHGEDLMCLLPDWRARGGGGWDNITGHLQEKFVTNLRLHVRIHLYRRVMTYLRKVAEDSDRAIDMFFGRSNISDGSDDIIVQKLRSILGVRPGAVIDQEFEHVKFHHLRLHVHLLAHMPQWTKGFSFCPVASLRRHYCRVDKRILASLLRTTGLETISFQRCFGVDPTECRKQRKMMRKKLRKKLMAKATTKDQKKRLRRRCKHLQVGRVPEGIVTSIETDGYGLSTFISIPLPPQKDDLESDVIDKDDKKIGVEPHRGKRPGQKYNEELLGFQKHVAGMVENHPTPLLKGLDPGAVNMIHSVFEYHSGQQVFFKVDRKSLAHDSGREAYALQCNRRMYYGKDAVKHAVSDMSHGSLRTSRLEDMMRLLEAQRNHWETLWQEYLVDDYYPKYRMWLYRKKRSCVDRYANRLLFEGRCSTTADGQVVKDRKRPVVIGYGGGKFDPTCGRYSVPTKSMKEAVDRGFKRFKRARKDGGSPILTGGVVIIDEYFTTKKCASCRSFLQKGKRLSVKLQVTSPDDNVHAVFGSAVDHRVMLCGICGNGTPIMLDRDGNAAVNILRILQAHVAGQDRPQYLCP